MKGALYFPDSPVNILSVTKFDKRFQRTIKHPASNLPELIVNEGWSIFHVFSKVVGTKVHLGKQFYHCHASPLIPYDGVELPQPETQTQLSLDEDFSCGRNFAILKERSYRLR